MASTKPNHAILSRRITFTHNISEDVVVIGNLSIRVLMPTENTALVSTMFLQPEQLVKVMLEAVDGKSKESFNGNE